MRFFIFSPKSLNKLSEAVFEKSAKTERRETNSSGKFCFFSNLEFSDNSSCVFHGMIRKLLFISKASCHYAYKPIINPLIETHQNEFSKKTF